jgi:hypothetical protein
MLVVSLEQIASPNCQNLPDSWGGWHWNCNRAKVNYFNKLFFYRLENYANRVDSLCTSELPDFSVDGRGVSKDKSYFEKPKWPGGEWPLKLFGKDYTYKSTRENYGALWKAGRADAITCSSDLGAHGKQDSDRDKEKKANPSRPLVG